MRFLGVEDGRILRRVGRFHPERHKGVDVFAPPGTPVYVPRRWHLEVVTTMYDPAYYKGQARGWVRVCGEKYGFVAAHFARAPEVRKYEPGDLLGFVAGRVSFTPHIHWALAYDHMPPPGEIDPVEVWERCKR